MPMVNFSRFAKTTSKATNYLSSFRERRKKIKASKIRIISGKETIVSVPDDDAIQEKDQPQTEQRESIKVQAKLAKIGEIFGFKIWLPKADRNRVTEFWHPKESTLLDELPIIFDETTLKRSKILTCYGYNEDLLCARSKLREQHLFTLVSLGWQISSLYNQC